MDKNEAQAWHRLGILNDRGGPGPWESAGLCSQTDPEAFFPPKGFSARPAQQVCGRCEVRQECLLYALATSERHGVWGGLSERRRRKLAAPDPVDAVSLAGLIPVVMVKQADVLQLHADGVASEVIAEPVPVGLSAGAAGCREAPVAA